jgi:hypothetical protein
MKMPTHLAKNFFPERKAIHDNDFSVTFAHYRAHSPKHILIIPPTGGINFIDESYARNFCAHGFNVMVLERWSGDDEYVYDLGIHNRLYSRVQRAIDVVMAKIPAGDFVGILGTSIGGMHAATAIGRVPRLRAGFVITGGIDIPSIIVRSEQMAMIEGKRKRYELYDYKNDEEYLTQLRPEIKLDGIHFQGHMGKHLGMAIASKDTVVPFHNQELLKNLWHPRKIIIRNSNHFWAIISTWLFHTREIVQFFEEAEVSEALAKTSNS